MSSVPESRISRLNGADVRPDGEYVLYWMIAARRTKFNFGLQRAVQLAVEYGVGLIVLEAVRCDYKWASDRLHAFIMQGMLANQRAFQNTPVHYYPYVEPSQGAGKGLLAALARRAVGVVTDAFPSFFMPHMVEPAAESLDVSVEEVDSNGLYPLRAAERDFTVAHSFRRHLQKELASHLVAFPQEHPLEGIELKPADVTDEIVEGWPTAPVDSVNKTLASLPIDHEVGVCDAAGGQDTAKVVLDRFVHDRLGNYDERNHPDEDAASGLSPWLHFGHISAHEVFQAVADSEDWTPEKLTGETHGKRHGWWGMGENAESFLDQLVIWRELGYQWCYRHPEDYARFDSLPDFARTTLRRHARDKRPYVYSLTEFENAQTHDEVWNAAQRQLVSEGNVHNYLRMLWGKKILHWTRSPEQALEFMIHLNNKYALDGRNPNTYSGIMWTLGRFDRAWGPEREVFGKVRYMTSESTRRKCRMEEYLERFGRNA